MNFLRAACFGIAVAALVLGFFACPSLPAKAPTHWNAAGEIDGYGPAWVAAFLMPAMMLLIALLFAAIPKMEVFKENLKAFEKEYWLLSCVLQAFFLWLFAVMLLPNYGVEINFSLMFTPAFGLMFIALGLLMPRFKRNFFVGIRTPWTIANDEVWNKTHKAGGKMFVAAGIISLLGALVPAYAIWIMLGAVIIAAVFAVVYSFLLYRKSGQRQI